MRKLASIQRIKAIFPIENADKIEVCQIEGWKVVVKSDEFKVLDKCVYIEIDSVLPEKPEFEFLRKSKFRIRTIRMRQQISQGIAFPLSILPTGDYVEGQDVTELIGITQYIPTIPAELKGLVKGKIPSFIPKTDEIRIQLLQSILDKFKGTMCFISEKLDGTSVTYFIKDGIFGVCSRNLELLETKGNAFWKFARENKIEEKLKSLNKNIAIQGELFGQGIQKNNLRIPEKKVMFFNIFDIDAFRYYDFEEFRDAILNIGLETVPILYTNIILINDIEKLVKLSISNSVINPKVYREGIVIRPMKEIVSLEMSNQWNNGRLTMKITNPEYLLLFE